MESNTCTDRYTQRKMNYIANILFALPLFLILLAFVSYSLRFSIKYLYLFKKSVSFDVLKSSLSRVLVDYYPLAGRLKSANSTTGDDQKLEVHCNGKDVFIEAFMDISAKELVELSQLPNESWRKLLYKVEGQPFVDTPPLVVQI